MPDPVADVLRTVQTSDRLRAAAWDAAYASDDPDQVAERLRALPIGDNARAKLWDARFAEQAPTTVQAATAAPPAPPNDARMQSPGQYLHDTLANVPRDIWEQGSGLVTGTGNLLATTARATGEVGSDIGNFIREVVGLETNYGGHENLQALGSIPGAVAEHYGQYLDPNARAERVREHPVGTALDLLPVGAGLKAGARGAAMATRQGAQAVRNAPAAAAAKAVDVAIAIKTGRPMAAVRGAMGGGPVNAARRGISEMLAGKADDVTVSPSPVVHPAPESTPTPAASAAPAESVASAPAISAPSTPAASPESAGVRPSQSTLSPQRIQNELGIQARRQSVRLSQEQYAEATALVNQGQSPAEAVAQVAKNPQAAVQTTAAVESPQAPATTGKIPKRSRLTADEADEYLRLLEKGMTHQEAVSQLMDQRKLATKLGTMTPDTMRERVARRLSRDNRTASEGPQEATSPQNTPAAPPAPVEPVAPPVEPAPPVAAAPVPQTVEPAAPTPAVAAPEPPVAVRRSRRDRRPVPKPKSFLVSYKVQAGGHGDVTTGYIVNAPDEAAARAIAVGEGKNVVSVTPDKGQVGRPMKPKPSAPPAQAEPQAAAPTPAPQMEAKAAPPAAKAPETPKPDPLTTPDSSPEYLAALEKSRAASKAFTEVQRKYRAGEIADEVYLAERKAYNESNQAFDKAVETEQRRGLSPGQPVPFKTAGDRMRAATRKLDAADAAYNNRTPQQDPKALRDAQEQAKAEWLDARDIVNRVGDGGSPADIPKQSFEPAPVVKPAKTTVTKAAKKAITPAAAAQQVKAQVEKVIDLQGAKGAADVQKRVIAALEEELSAAAEKSGFNELTYQPHGKEGSIYADGKLIGRHDQFGDLTIRGLADEEVKIESMYREWKGMTPATRRADVLSRAANSLAKEKITVQIPGDGTFTVNRNPAAIRGVLDRLKSGGTSPWRGLVAGEKPKPKPKPRTFPPDVFPDRPWTKWENYD
jgi:hypothetical protein